MKRGRGRDEPDEAIETRLVNLIVRVGDRNVTSQLSSHLEGLARALEGDIATHRRLIIDTLLDCARSLHTKSGVYGTLSGLLNASDDNIGLAIVEGAHKELQGALDDHATMGIRGLTRFVVELMNARVVTASSCADLLEALVATSDDTDGPTARADWFCVVAMDALVLCGKTLSTELPERLNGLVARLRDHAAKREPLATSAPLLLPFGASTSTDELVEHFDAAFSVLNTMHEDGGWSSPYLLAPYRAFSSELAGGKRHGLGAVNLPAHTEGCTYPTLHRLRLLPGPRSTDGSDAPMREPADGGGAEAMDEGGDGVGRRGAELALADRIVLEEGVFMLISAFSASHKDCAKLLVGMGDELGVDISPLLVEVLLSLMLSLPAPKHQLMYYSSLFVDLCKLLTPFPVALERALNELFARLPRLDVQLMERLGDWLAFHVSNFGFSLTPFGKPWGDAIVDALPAIKMEDSEAEGGGGGEGGGGASSSSSAAATVAARMAASPDPRARFIALILERMVRLSYLERVEKTVPSAFLPLLPPRPTGCLAWEDVRDGDLQPTSPAGLSAALLARLRGKQSMGEVTAWIDSEVAKQADDPITLVVHTLLHAGAKSVSHLEKLLEKYSWLLVHIAPDAQSKSALVGAGCAYWARSGQMTSLLCRKLIGHRVVDASAIVSHAFSRGSRKHLLVPAGWEIVDEALDWVVRRQRDTARAVANAERRLERMAAHGAGESELGGAEELCGDAKQGNEHARREKKAAFANLFAGACTALSDPPPMADEAEGTEWRRMCIGRTHAVGRLYRNDFSLQTVEMVAEGSEISEEVRAEVFGPLRKLAACCG